MAFELFQLLGRVRRLIVPTYGEADEKVPAINDRAEFIVSQGLPERTELVRLGNSWSAQIKDANAFTALITIPTTLAGLALQNGEPSGGKSYVIDRVWCKNVTTTAAANYVTILAQVITSGTTLVADSANKTVQSLNGKSSYTGRAQIAIASTAVGALTDKWMPLAGAGNSQPTSTSIAALVEANVYGKYVIPPGATFALNAQEAVSGGTMILGVEWHEVQLPIG